MKYPWLLALPLAAAATEATLRWLERRATRFAQVTHLPHEGEA